MSRLKLMNGSEVAQWLGMSRTTLQAMKRWPDDPLRFSHGRRTTVQAVTAWMKKHPEFRAAKVYGPGSRATGARNGRNGDKS